MYRELKGRVEFSTDKGKVSKERGFGVNVVKGFVNIQLTDSLSIIFKDDEFFTALGAPTTEKEENQ